MRTFRESVRSAAARLKLEELVAPIYMSPVCERCHSILRAHRSRHNADPKRRAVCR